MIGRAVGRRQWRRVLWVHVVNVAEARRTLRVSVGLHVGGRRRAVRRRVVLRR